MAFDKAYFDSLDKTLVSYEKKVKPKRGITVTVHIFTGERFRIALVFEKTDSVISFLIYEKETKPGDDLPMVAVPYSAIVSVRVEPSAKKSALGFERKGQ
jgi:hypothetical protein